MRSPDIAKRVQGLLMPVLEDRQLELIDMKIGQYGKNVTIRILADRTSGGITIEECTSVNKRLGRLIEKHEILTGEYSVEVSSPGIDWPICTRKDFERVVNKKIRIVFSDNDGSSQECVGVVCGVNEMSVLINQGEASRSIALEKIDQALQVVK